jgi:hypothetical protein
MFANERRQSVVMGGAKLEIIATLVKENEWMLTVVNSLGVQSTWIESFLSANEAINKGLEAIKSEGAEAFTDIEGFDYLKE